MKRLLVLTAAVTLGACGGGTDGDRGDATLPEPPRTMSGDTDDTGSGAATTDVRGESLVVTDQGFETVELSWGISVTAVAEAVNTTDRYVEDMSYSARYLDADGALLHDDSGSTGSAAPGDTLVLPSSHVFETTDPRVANVEFVLEPPVLTDGIVFGDIDLPALQLSIVQTRVAPDFNEVPTALAVVHNGGAERVVGVRVACSLRRDGRLVGGDFGYVTEVLPGGDGGAMMWSNSGESEMPDEATCHVAPDRLLKATAPDERGVELTSQGFSVAPRSYTSGYDLMAAVLLTNPTDQVLVDVGVQIDFYDSGGQLLIIGHSDGYMLPKERAVFAPSAVLSHLDPAVARIVVGVDVRTNEPENAVTEVVPGETIDMRDWVFAVEGARYFTETPAHIVGTIVNPQPLAVPRGLRVECALLLDDETIGGAGFSVLDSLPASGTVGFDVITVFGSTPQHDEVFCTAHMTASFETG